MATPRASPPNRGRPPSASRADVIEAGVRIARESGFAGLTMGRLADELAVSAMTAYGYVRNKQELCRLVVDAVLAEVAVPGPDEGTWTDRLVLIMRQARDLLVQVRGAREVVGAHGATPHAVRLADAIVAILLDAGFAPTEATLAFDTLFTYVTGQLELDESLTDPTRADLDERIAFHGRVVQPSVDEIFDYGLATVLRGLRANLESSRREN